LRTSVETDSTCGLSSDHALDLIFGHRLRHSNRRIDAVESLLAADGIESALPKR
jgi:hypothetical protein